MPEPDRPCRLSILHLLPWLNYGGAEGYVVKLAGALAARGHRVAVASAGGMLEPELARLGVPHRHLDLAGLHAPAGLVRLRRLIAREQVSLLCAHSWTAGAVGWLAARWAGIPFLLTVHGTRHPWQRHLVFYWSRPVLAASPASREQLVSGFRLPAAQVRSVPIGVDPARFFPGEPDLALARELGLRAGPVLVHVSRLSASKAVVAQELAAAAVELEHAHPGLQVVLVGEGPRAGRVSAAAAAANRALGRAAVVCPGSRGDVAQVLRLADVVVGAATVALEGMACGKPVLAAGKAGLGGVVEEHNLSALAHSNFGDHGRLPRVTAAGLVRELGPVLADGGLRARLGAFGRRVVLERYTVEHAAEAAQGVYREVTGIRNGDRILVFHLNQVGDLIFSLPALRALHQALPDSEITSVCPPYLAPLLAGIPSVARILPREPKELRELWSLVGRLRQVGAAVGLGFSQSPHTSLLMALARVPLRVGFLDSGLPWLLNRRVQCRGITTARKLAAAVELLGIPVPDTSYQGLVQPAPGDLRAADELLAAQGVVPGRRLVAIGPGASERRGYKAWGTERFRELAEALAGQGAQVVIVGAPAEVPAGEAIAAGQASVRNLAGQTSLGVLAGVLSRADLYVGIDSGPMHLAAAVSVPVVGIFGPTDHGLTGPPGRGHVVVSRRLACAPCRGGCKDRPCLTQIPVEEVLAATAQASRG